MKVLQDLLREWIADGGKDILYESSYHNCNGMGCFHFYQLYTLDLGGGANVLTSVHLGLLIDNRLCDPTVTVVFMNFWLEHDFKHTLQFNRYIASMRDMIIKCLLVLCESACDMPAKINHIQMRKLKRSKDRETPNESDQECSGNLWPLRIMCFGWAKAVEWTEIWSERSLMLSINAEYRCSPGISK
jgi:hypothetical protein